VDDIDAESRDRAMGETEVRRAQAPARKLDDLDAERSKAIEEDPVAGRADHQLEFVSG
jgi:hypothetical protein